MKKIVQILPVIMMIATFSCIVDDITVKTDSITIENPAGSATMKIGETLNATVTIAPVNATDQTFTLKSSDGAVATVVKKNSDQCCGVYDITITAAGAGTCNISAETSNGKSHSIAVTVQANIPVITITTQPAATTSVTAGSITGSLTVAASVTEGATLSYQWHSNTSVGNTGGTVVTGATGASFTIPASLAAGTYYYFCEVGATGGAASVRSNVAIVTVEADTDFCGGSGTSDDPYLICTAKQLAKLAELVNSGTEEYNDKYYKLVNDIDISAYGATWNDGKGWIPFGVEGTPFVGNFNGNGKIVSGLYINNTTLRAVGLFGNVNTGGIVYNLGVEGAITTNGSYAGGVSGAFNGGSIINCYANVDVIASGSYIGGVVGEFILGSTMINCYSTGSVHGSGSFVGGVAGDIQHGNSSISNCYATGAISSGIACGVIGRIWSGSVTNCTALNPGTAITPSQAKDQAFYEDMGWKFGNDDDNPWQMGTGEYKLPALYWQTSFPEMPEHLE